MYAPIISFHLLNFAPYKPYRPSACTATTIVYPCLISPLQRWSLLWIGTSSIQCSADLYIFPQHKTPIVILSYIFVTLVDFVVAMSLSESLNNFYMEVDSADALEESRNFTPNLSFNRSNRQTPYTQSQLSLHSQAASQDHEFDYDYPNDYPAASCDDEILAHGELGSIDSGLGDTNIDLADIGGLGIGDSICHSTEETEIIEGGTRLTERPKSRFVSLRSPSHYSPLQVQMLFHL